MTDEIRIKPGSSGKLLALVKSSEQDGSAEDRFYQYYIESSDKLTLTSQRASVSSDDGADLTSLSGTALSVGEGSVLVVQVVHDQSDGEATITPIMFDDTGTPVKYVGTSKTTAMGTVAFTDGAGVYKSPVLFWDLIGATSVKFHISGLSASNTVTVYAGVI